MRGIRRGASTLGATHICRPRPSYAEHQSVLVQTKGLAGGCELVSRLWHYGHLARATVNTVSGGKPIQVPPLESVGDVEVPCFWTGDLNCYSECFEPIMS